MSIKTDYSVNYKIDSIKGDHTIRELSEKEFIKNFSGNDVKTIETDESKKSMEASITSFSIGDCITLFGIGIGKNHQKIEAIYGWHISKSMSVKLIKDDFLNALLNFGITGFEQFENSEGSDEVDQSEKLKEGERNEQGEKKYKLILIGGSHITTKGLGCLLKNIYQALKEYFPEGSYEIVVELLNLNEGTNKKFVSANLQMDGTLSYCRH